MNNLSNVHAIKSKSYKNVRIHFIAERFWKESYAIICIVENRPQYRFLYVTVAQIWYRHICVGIRTGINTEV